MSLDSACLPMRIASPVPGQCRRARLIGPALIAQLLTGLTLPSAALAHGPVNPAASSYLATVDRTPPGVKAIALDGDQRMWLSVRPRVTALVLDYRGAPYLRFSARGVEVNRNSAMYYSNQVPPEQVPPGLGPGTPPSWLMVSSGHGYSWHDGRLHALAATALAPGSSYVGSWRIPLRISGRPSAISGGPRYAPDPSLVWFWPIVVVVGCALAGLRLHETELDRRLARSVALVAVLGVAVTGSGEELHGRPGVSDGQYVLLALVLAFVAWGLVHLVRRREGWFGYFVIALAAIWEGASLVGVLTHGFVLIAPPAVVARVAVVLCLASGGALLPVIFRLAERPDRSGSSPPAAGAKAWEDDASWVGDV